MNIVLLDPGIPPKNHSQVKNLGDMIISEAITNKLSFIFPDQKITRLSSHNNISGANAKTIKNADMVIVGGTNLLSSFFKKMNSPLGPNKSYLDVLFPKLKNVILFGVGWGYGYNKPVESNAVNYYKKIFKHGSVQSVRDFSSEYKLRESGINNAVNTNCPTMWQLSGLSSDLSLVKTKNAKCLFTLTDYLKDFGQDNLMLDVIAEHFDDLVFFPQGKGDLLYLSLLPAHNKYKSRITVLDRSLEAYDQFIENNDLVYIGTRLHGGIRCLQKGKPALIISIDNRAEEISKDTNLACFPRSECAKINDWLSGKTKFGNIKLNLEGIDSFLNQF